MSEDKNVLKSKVFKTAEMVHIQEGTVVSRTLINQPGGTVTLFAFDAGQGLSEHAAPFDALVQVLEGEVDITISGKPFHLETGEMVIMPANEPHGLKTERGLKMLLAMIKP
jgi:quercetin dioxygenase-like cupin family protein